MINPLIQEQAGRGMGSILEDRHQMVMLATG
jgi:hypothetical protein